MHRRGAALLVPAVALVLTVLGAPQGAGAEVKGAVIVVSPSTVAVGDQVRVDLMGWPEGVVTASVCGNAAKRGSTDCDQIGGGSIRVPANGTETLTVDVLAPPVGCPCVVRATTTLGDVVRTAPVTVLGVPTGVDIAPPGGVVDSSVLHVTSQLRNAAVPWPKSWFAAFGGPAYKELVLTMRNTGDLPLEGLRVAGRVGHQGTNEGEPVNAVVPVIPAHSTRQVVVPVLLSAPVYGDYSVKGAIYGLATPVRFVEQTTSEPWAFEIGLPLLLLLVAQLLRARDRRRLRADEARALAEAAALAAAAEEAAAIERAQYAAVPPAPALIDLGETAVFPQSSPAVGEPAVGGLESSSYARASMGTVETAMPEVARAPVEEALR
jgi:hypothetical protein